MSDYLLTIPEAVYQRAQQIADETAQPVDTILLEYLKRLSPPVPALAAREEAELAALQQLSEDALWTIAREQMSSDVQTRMQDLMDKNSMGTITADEYPILAQLVERSEQLMVRKSEAAAILRRRGHQIKPQDLAPGE